MDVSLGCAVSALIVELLLFACLREPSRRRGAMSIRHTLSLALSRWRTTPCLYSSIRFEPGRGGRWRLGNFSDVACTSTMYIPFRVRLATQAQCARGPRPPTAQPRVRLAVIVCLGVLFFIYPRSPPHMSSRFGFFFFPNPPHSSTIQAFYFMPAHFSAGVSANQHTYVSLIHL